jgi:zinc protease
MKTLALAVLLIGLFTATTPAAEMPRHVDALRIESLDFTLPEPVSFTLTNGVRVYLFEDHALPLVALSAQVPMDVRFLPLAERTAFSILSPLWRDGGAGELSPEAVDERVAVLGMELDALGGAGYGQVRAQMAKEDLELGARLARDLFLYPTFAADRLARAQAQEIKDLQGINDDPNALAEFWFSRLLSGPDTPGWRLTQSADIEAVDRDAVLRLFQAFMQPEAVVVGIAGDIELGEARRLMQALFGEWQAAAAATLPAAVPWQRRPVPGVYLLPGDFSQCHVRYGRPVTGLTDRNADYPLARFLDYGVGYNRIYLRTRREGLSYGTTTRLTADAVWAQFLARGSTAPASLPNLIRAICEEVAAVNVDRPLTADEIAGTRTFLLGVELRSLETLSGVVGRRLSDLVTGRGGDYMPRMIAGLQAADAASLAAAAARWVDFGPAPVLLVVGAPEGGTAALEGLGLGPVTVLEPVRFGE